MENKLYRSFDNRLLGGVCSGLSEYLNMDVTIIRLIFIILSLFGFGVMAIIYLIMWIVVPEKPIKL